MPSVQQAIQRGAVTRWRPSSRTVHCNANSGHSGRIKFQNSRETTAQRLKSGAPSDSKLWLNAGLSQARRQIAQITEPTQPIDTMPDSIFEEALAPLDKKAMARSVRAVILAGGETSNPLTRHRAMPAVPIGSALKLIDIPINNCMQAGVNKIYVLTQFQSHTLNSHISSTYPPVQFAGPEGCGWVDVLAAMQTATEKDGWYTGSADAIRKNINELKDEARGIAPATDYIILSGSAVYTLDMGRVLAYHRARNADVTMVTSLVSEELAPTKGIAQVHQSSGRVLKFEEKPSASSLKGMYSEINEEDGSQSFMANMGIYIFKREALFELLSSTHPAKSQAITHIGHHVIPNALASGMKVHAYHHKGYWHDVSTLRDYYEANLDLAKDDAGVKQFEVEQGVSQTKGRMLPPAIMQGDVFVKSSLIDDGAVLVDCRVTNSVIGEKMFVGPSSVVENSLLLGSLNWTNQSLRAKAQSKGERVYGIGSNCVIRDCILDKNVTIGDNVKIINAENVQELDRADSHGYMIQDGIVVVMRGAIIPDGTVI